MTDDLSAAVERSVSENLEQRGDIRTADWLDIPQEAREKIDRAGCLSQSSIGASVFADVDDESGDVSVVVQMTDIDSVRLIHAGACTVRGVLETMGSGNLGREGQFVGSIDDDAELVVSLAAYDMYRFEVDPDWSDLSHARLAAKVAKTMQAV